MLGLPWDMHRILPADVRCNVVTLNVRNGRLGEHEWALSAMKRAVDVSIDEGAEAIVVQGCRWLRGEALQERAPTTQR